MATQKICGVTKRWLISFLSAANATLISLARPLVPANKIGYALLIEAVFGYKLPALKGANAQEFLNSLTPETTPRSKRELITSLTRFATTHFRADLAPVWPEEAFTLIDHALTQLEVREAQVIEMCFGLKSGKAMSYPEAAEHFGFHKERVRQIEAKALRKLRHQSRARLLKPLTLSSHELLAEMLRENVVDSTPIHEKSYIEALRTSVDSLELSVRTYNALKNAGILTVAQLVEKPEAEFIKMPNFGRKSLNELKDLLPTLNLELGMTIPSDVKE